MEAEKLVFDYCGQGQKVKKLSQAFPDVGVTIFAAALIVKAINLSYLPGFMVSAQNGNPVFVSDFES